MRGIHKIFRAFPYHPERVPARSWPWETESCGPTWLLTFESQRDTIGVERENEICEPVEKGSRRTEWCGVVIVAPGTFWALGGRVLPAWPASWEAPHT
jgi:hypothetical protein